MNRMDQELMNEVEQTIGMQLGPLTLSMMKPMDWVFLMHSATGTAEKFAKEDEPAGYRRAVLELIGFGIRALRDLDQKTNQAATKPTEQLGVDAQN